MTSPESVTDPRHCWSLFSFHYTHSCPQKSAFPFLHHPKGAAVQGLPLPPGVQRGAGSSLQPARQELPAGLSSLCPDKASPTDSQFGEKDCTQHSRTDITTSLNKLLICDSIFTPQICFQSLLCFSSCFALSQLSQATLSAAFRY